MRMEKIIENTTESMPKPDNNGNIKEVRIMAIQKNTSASVSKILMANDVRFPLKFLDNDLCKNLVLNPI